ncbi:hypothetical protein ACFUTR_05370 [Streptomyces sp. NPDC057367]|uniref:hypothetical protein n=1 Tax=Streptomyces sp. NPDC057367 TaxID=3346108 RepID=UPI00364052F5
MDRPAGPLHHQPARYPRQRRGCQRLVPCAALAVLDESTVAMAPHLLYETLGPTLPDGARSVAVLWARARRIAKVYGRYAPGRTRERRRLGLRPPIPATASRCPPSNSSASSST